MKNAHSPQASKILQQLFLMERLLHLMETEYHFKGSCTYHENIILKTGCSHYFVLKSTSTL